VQLDDARGRCAVTVDPLDSKPILVQARSRQNPATETCPRRPNLHGASAAVDSASLPPHAQRFRREEPRGEHICRCIPGHAHGTPGTSVAPLNPISVHAHRGRQQMRVGRRRRGASAAPRQLPRATGRRGHQRAGRAADGSDGPPQRMPRVRQRVGSSVVVAIIIASTIHGGRGR